MHKDDRIERDSKFELLRIMCIILIIAYHYSIHGHNGTIFKSDISINQIISIVVGSWGMLGVNCFILVSAYFLIECGKFSSRKLLKILLQTVFYASSISAVLYFTETASFHPVLILKSFIAPFLIHYYWYITAYCVLYLIFPFLNEIIYKMDRVSYNSMLILLTLIIPIYKTIFPSAPIGEFGWVIYLYLLMGYLKKNPWNWFERNAKIGFYVTSICIVFISIAISYAGTINDNFQNQECAFVFARRFSLVMVLNAIFLFYIFTKLNIKTNIKINTIASTTLGIYMLHEHPLLGKVLWDEILRINEFYYSSYYFIHLIVSVLMLFILGVVIDFIRIRFIEKPLFSIKINRLEKIISKIDSLMNTQSYERDVIALSLPDEMSSN